MKKLQNKNKESEDLPTVSNDFLNENKSDLGQFIQKSRRSGPHNSHDREIRRNEVYRLHFEYGYSARKIAELLKINRNTINGDISYWYSKVVNKAEVLDPEYWVVRKLERFEIQRTRIREQLDKESDYEKKISLERFLFNIESKILQIQIKLVDSEIRHFDSSRKTFNEWLKKKGHQEQYLTLFDILRVSTKASDKISKIIDEDKKRAEQQ